MLRFLGCRERRREPATDIAFAKAQSAGFLVPWRPLPVSAVGGVHREVLVWMLAAIVMGDTPEEIAGYLADGFPGKVHRLLADPLERAELEAHAGLVAAAAGVAATMTTA